MGLDGEPHPLPFLSEEDRVLNALTLLWSEAGGLMDEANELEDEAANKRAQADDKMDTADELAKALLDARPEWRDAIEDQVDPRTVDEP